MVLMVMRQDSSVVFQLNHVEVVLENDRLHTETCDTQNMDRIAR